MCFVTDCDWEAETQIKSHLKAKRRMICRECNARIEEGEEYFYIFQQEHEICNVCYEGDCDCPKDEDDDCIECKCEEPDFGENFEYHSCLSCEKFLKAVQEAEVESGCSIYESQPYLEQMKGSIQEGGMEEAKKYFKKAKSMFPELVKSGYLGQLWKGLFT